MFFPLPTENIPEVRRFTVLVLFLVGGEKQLSYSSRPCSFGRFRIVYGTTLPVFSWTRFVLVTRFLVSPSGPWLCFERRKRHLLNVTNSFEVSWAVNIEKLNDMRRF